MTISAVTEDGVNGKIVNFVVKGNCVGAIFISEDGKIFSGTLDYFTVTDPYYL